MINWITEDLKIVQPWLYHCQCRCVHTMYKCRCLLTESIALNKDLCSLSVNSGTWGSLQSLTCPPTAGSRLTLVTTQGMRTTSTTRHRMWVQLKHSFRNTVKTSHSLVRCSSSWQCEDERIKKRKRSGLKRSVVSHQGGFSLDGGFYQVISHQGGLFVRWSFCQGGLSPRWSLIG